ncbi:MAG: SMC-Scp complex subunit ScpB [Calditrichota bacterium]
MAKEKLNTDTLADRQLSDKEITYLPIIEALVFASEAPLPIAKIREIIPALSPKQITMVIEYLNEQYRQGGRSYEIREIAGGYQMFTLPEFAAFVDKLYQEKQQSRLTQKSLETLAIVAYKQPVTRHEIEEIRGVNVDGVMKTLVTISGRAQAPGSPFLYKTTKKFLDYFGLKSLEDLPKIKEIEELIDVEDEERPYHETILREINLSELGLKENGNGEINNREENGEREESDQA